MFWRYWICVHWVVALSFGGTHVGPILYGSHLPNRDGLRFILLLSTPTPRFDLSLFNRFFLFLAAISVKVKQTQFYFFTLAVLFNLISEFCNFNQLILLFIVIRVEMNQTLLLLFSFKLCYWMLPMNVLFESVSDSC
jgi:hypothetical protein